MARYRLAAKPHCVVNAVICRERRPGRIVDLPEGSIVEAARPVGESGLPEGFPDFLEVERDVFIVRTGWYRLPTGEEAAVYGGTASSAD